MKKVLILIVVLLSFVGVLFLIQTDVQEIKKRPKVMTSTFALYDMTKHIGGEKVDVEMAIPFGVEVHSFEPTPKTIIEIKKSALFLYSGASLEPWIKKLNLHANMLDMSQYVVLREIHKDDEDAHHHEHYDPHYWMDIENMKLLTEKITQELIKLQPENKSYFENNAASYMDELVSLQAAYESGLKVCAVREVVLQHNILGYVAPRYKFHVSSLSGLSPDALTNAKKMAELSQIIKKRGIEVLFFESFSSERMINALAQENGVKVDYLEPLANITAAQAKAEISYVDGMRSNLEKLRSAMRCQ